MSYLDDFLNRNPAILDAVCQAYHQAKDSNDFSEKLRDYKGYDISFAIRDLVSRFNIYGSVHPDTDYAGIVAGYLKSIGRNIDDFCPPPPPPPSVSRDKPDASAPVAAAPQESVAAPPPGCGADWTNLGKCEHQSRPISPYPVYQEPLVSDDALRDIAEFGKNGANAAVGLLTPPGVRVPAAAPRM